MTRRLCFRTLCWLALLPMTALAWEKDKPATPPVIPPNPKNLPKVLLIGDSISSGYYPSVAKALEGKAVVAKSSDNGESTAVGVIKIDGWLGDTKWDVIHFNWGVWDMYGWQYATDDRSPAMYAQRLETLVLRMKKTGARMIWATTTPVPPKPEATMLKRWKKEVVIDGELERQYQEAALQVMKKHEVRVNDLYALLKPRRGEFQPDDDVHFSGAGTALMAKQTAECILKSLGSAPEKRDADPKQKPATPAASESIKALQEEFLKLKFGMFIHYNMETYKNVQWVSGYHSPADFNPGGPVDTDAWADAAKSAGMKYAVLTAKHVSGFCLWDSKYTTYDVMNPDCPYKQDLVAQFIKSFTSRGLKVGLYYCWRHPGFKAEYKVLPPECDPAKHSLAEQIEFQKKQIAELVEKYPEAFYIWNDSLDPEIMPAEDARKFMRSLGPNIIGCGNWWDWGKKGSAYLDLLISETRHHREREKTYKYEPAETCWCLENGWFYSGGIKNAKDMVSHIITANSRHSNFLLNVGPDKQGKISEASVKTLNEIGSMWIPINKILSGDIETSGEKK